MVTKYFEYYNMRDTKGISSSAYWQKNIHGTVKGFQRINFFIFVQASQNVEVRNYLH